MEKCGSFSFIVMDQAIDAWRWEVKLHEEITLFFIIMHQMHDLSGAARRGGAEGEGMTKERQYQCKCQTKEGHVTEINKSPGAHRNLYKKSIGIVERREGGEGI